MSAAPDIRFPGESSEYRRERNRLLDAEIELRRTIERGAAQRHAETPGGEQIPVLNVFVRDGTGIRHSWATELMFAPRDEGEEPRHVDSIWPIWSVLDIAPEGRGTEPDFPRLDYR